jgi:transposase-like protein
VRLPISDNHINGTAKNGRSPLIPETPADAGRPDPQVTQRAVRRRFSVAYKLRILADADACGKPGDLGALLRREGLYSSTLSNFRRQRDQGKLGIAPEKLRLQRLDKEAARHRDARKLAQLEAENKKLKILLDLQKKVAELMNLPLDNQTDA